jgi:head-tail adaptor
MEPHENADGIGAKGRLLARLVRVLLDREKYETLPDLTEALKVECARLKIRWTADDITAAYRLIESNRPLPGLTPIRRITHLERLDDDVRPITRAEAAEIWPRLVAAVQRTQRTA